MRCRAGPVQYTAPIQETRPTTGRLYTASTRKHELYHTDQESISLSALKDLDHEVGIDHTDHTDHLSDVWMLATVVNYCQYTRATCYERGSGIT